MSDYEDDSEHSDECCVDGCDCRYDRSPKRRKTYPHQRINPFVRTTAPALKDMASATIAISLWKHVNIMRTLIRIDDYCVRDSYSWNSLIQKVKGLSSKLGLRIPPAVNAHIHQYICMAQKEITRWATYHFRSVYLNMEKDFVVYNRVKDIIWRCDGTIDYIETVKNISKSKSPVINEMEKYNFLCTYCLENEMQQMTSVLSNISDFQDYLDFEHHPLIFYWNHYFSEKLDLIPIEEDEDEDLSLDCTMFRHRYVDNWPAKEYFFDRLSSDDQVVNAIWLIDKLGTVYQKVLLMKLNESQRISVYLERSVQIIMNYVKTGVNSMDAIMTWSEVRNLITREQFVDLLEQLLDARAPVSVLTEVWISVDFDFKNYFLSYDDYKFIQKILDSFDWTNDFNFVLIVLQDLNADMKTHVSKQFFDSFCEKLFSKRENLHWLDRLSDVYHDHAENSKQFKQHFLLNSRSIKNLCLKYYSSGDVAGLNDMLTYVFSQIPDRIPEYKRYLLMSSESRFTCIELLISNIENLNKVIVDSLPATDLQIEFRKNLVFSKLAIEKLQDLLFKNDLSKVKVIIDSFLTSDDDKKLLKKSLIGNPTNLIRNIFCRFDEPMSNLQSLLLLLVGDETLVKEFKKHIEVDSIFNQMLKQIVPENDSRWPRNDLNPASFDPLTRFLNWYFESPSEVKFYKLRRIFSYSSIDVIVSLLRRRRQDEVERLKTLMKWFFENDTVQIQKFNNTYKRLKVGTLL